MRIHQNLDESELPDILDRIVDKGLSLESSALVAFIGTEPCDAASRLKLATVEMNTSSYAEPAKYNPYARFRK